MIYYFGYYKSKHIEDNMPNGGINAISFKMSYIIKKLRETGERLTVISSYISDKIGFCPLRKVVVDDIQTDYYLPTLRLSGVLSKLSGLFRLTSVFLFTLFLIQPGSTVIVYHHPSFSPYFVFLKKLKNLNLILEVEEVYYENNKAKNQGQMMKKEQYTFNNADSYIVVNDLIFDKYLDSTKKHIVIYGAYDQLDSEHIEATDGKIHVLFSGSIDRVRGAFLAVETAHYLSGKYCMHISGSGNSEDIILLAEMIKSNNSNSGHCQIVYHGQLPENELNRLAFSCDIGLNLQDVDNPFEAVSFPSKITFYLLHGLNVVSTKMTSVMASKLSRCVNFTNMSAREVAETVSRLTLRDAKENQMRISELDDELTGEMRWIIKY